MTDGVSGETISYQYDALKRLTSACVVADFRIGNSSRRRTQNYSYDGFGNLTGKGSGSAVPVNSATNQLQNQTGVLSNVAYDSNGNLLSMTKAGASGLTMTYDGSNRVHSATVGSGTEYYGYDPGGHRIYRLLTNGTEEWTLYGIQGEKLGTFSMVMTCGDFVVRSDDLLLRADGTDDEYPVWVEGGVERDGIGEQRVGTGFHGSFGNESGERGAVLSVWG